MAIRKSELYSSLWGSCDELRGGMDASQYKNYVLMLLLIKSISDAYAGQPIAPLVSPEGWLRRHGGAQRDGGGADSKCLRIPGSGCRRAIAISSPMSCVTLRLPGRTDANPANRNRFRAAVRRLPIQPAPWPQSPWASSCGWVSRIQCQPSMLQRSLTRRGRESGIVRRLVKNKCLASRMCSGSPFARSV